MFYKLSNGCCLLCAASVAAQTALCQACLLELPYLHCPCSRCALELGTNPPAHGYCEPCLNEPPFFDYCLALGRYEFPLQELISQFKFNAKLSAGRALSLALLHEILSNLRKDPPEAFLPVPLHRKRIRNRGFNQSTEIAKLLAKHSQAPLLEDYCYRKRVTAPQRGLSASARANNLNGAFAIKKTHERWQHIAIVDDVVTTKSTVNAIAQLLKQEGVKKVGVICLARVSEPSRTDI